MPGDGLDMDREAAAREQNAQKSPVSSWPRRARKLALLLLVMIAIVVVPFLLFGETLDRLARDMMMSPLSRPLAAVAGFLLLAADVVLPIPSTVVISILGAVLGIAGGTLVATAALTLGCALGYWLGHRLGHDVTERMIGREDFQYLTHQLERYGLLMLVLCRPVPVLAEASVIAAGVAGLPARHVLAITTLANIGVAATYAALGSSAETGSGLLAALAASIGLPLVAMFTAKTVRRATRAR